MSQDIFKTSYVLNSNKPISFLEKALDDFSSIKRKGEEFIVIYAGKDETYHLDKKFPWVDKWIIELDECEAHGYNKGILSAEGTVLKLLSDDDEWIQEVVHEAIDLCYNEKFDVVFTSGISIDSTTKKTSYHSGILSEIMDFKNTCGLSIVFKKSIIPLIGLLDYRHKFVDLDFVTRILTSNLKIRSIPKLGFRRNINSLSVGTLSKERAISDRMFSILNNSNILLKPLNNVSIHSNLVNNLRNNDSYRIWLGHYISLGMSVRNSYKVLPIKIICNHFRYWFHRQVKQLPGAKRLYKLIKGII